MDSIEISEQSSVSFDVVEQNSVLCDDVDRIMFRLMPILLLDKLKRSLLMNRVMKRKLLRILEHCGWEVTEANAGVSVNAKPSTLLGKQFEHNKNGSTCKLNLNDSNIRETMLRAMGLCINGASWIES
ncbi:Aminotransferase, class I/classII [Artemisia annua]|uniref:Aminotransferase, class I/classII n=1 Tax=Artemisia annua TaxID=35608 RepID=A0A2U1L2Z0_ARTAN|nr:Aminotransferase, class I/classII [Artemisia annua]